MKNLSNKNIIHKKNGEIEYIQFKKLLQYDDKITHCFTLRNLDFKGKCKEDLEYQKICDELKLDNSWVVSPQQVHGKTVKIVEQNNHSGDFIEVDGLITKEPKKCLALSFADCTPLLMYDPKKNVIANVHSGWRGTVKKIGAEAVRLMVEKFKSDPADIICCIAPTIRKCHFEVEEDVKNLFLNAFKDESIITKR